MAMPSYAQDAISSQGQNSFGGGGIGQGLMGLIQHFLSNNKNPYDEAQNASKPYFENAENTQNPFFNQGKQAIGGYNDWLNTQKNPSDFINNQMNNYQESPYAKYLQQASVRAGTNAASASGLTGSTPFAQQLQQNATNISGQDQQNWLSNVLGINTQYGQGLNNQINTGQHASDNLNQLFQTEGNNAGQSAYGSTAYDNQNNNDIWSFLSKFLMG